MNKFLKGAVACAAIVPCLTGLAGCGEKKAYTAENAYNDIWGEVRNITTKMSGITTPNTEFQLNLNLAVEYKTIIEGMSGMDESMKANIRAVIGAKHGDNKQLFANLGIVGEDDAFTSLLSAYASDDIDAVDGDSDEAFTQIIVPESDWNYYKGVVYVMDNNEYVLAGDTFDASATYFMKTTDYMHIYLASNISVLKNYELVTTEPTDWQYTYTDYYTKTDTYNAKSSTAVYEANKYYRLESSQFTLLTDATAPADWATGTYYTKATEYNAVEESATVPTFEANKYYAQTGIDVNELLHQITDGELALPEGKIYATLNIGDEKPEIPDPNAPATEDEESMDISTILNNINNLDYATFVESVGGGEDVTVSGAKDKSGNITLTMSANGTTMQLIANAGGGITLKVDITQSAGGYTQIISATLDIDIVDEIDEDYIPTNLADYGDEPADFEELLSQFIGE